MGTIKSIKRKIKSCFIKEKITPITIPFIEGEFLKDKNAVITGGAGGIGFAIAERFVANGANVVIAGRNEDRLIKACSNLGERAKYIVIDLDNCDSYEKKVNEIITSLYSRVDILVNSAGVHGPSDFWTITPNDWDEVMNANLKGMYFLCQAFGKYFRNNNIHGHILNISSASALKHGKTPYEISKNGVKTITLGLAEEMIKYGIVVNCLAPGPTATKMLNMGESSALNWPGNPSGRVATPTEIANWAVLMSSDMGNYIVGDSFYVTGGSGTICIDK